MSGFIRRSRQTTNQSGLNFFLAFDSFLRPECSLVSWYYSGLLNDVQARPKDLR